MVSMGFGQRTGRNMRIAFFDNLANNAYSLTKVFRKEGYETDLILDALDTYPMSQPIWEDCDLTIGTDLLGRKRLTYQYWEQKARELGWERPSWIKEPRRKRRRDVLIDMTFHPYRNRGLIRRAMKHRSLFSCSFESVKETMEGYDLIIGFGLGPIFAFSVKIPFIHYPYGADLTLFPFEKSHISSLQRTALEHARYVIVGDPNYFDSLKRLGIESKGQFIPFMIDTDVYKPLPRDQALDSVDPDLRNRIQNRFAFFVPSRQDFYWKSSDKMLIAFAKLVQKRDDVFMILSGWGTDLQKSREMIDQLNLREHTFFLPHILSKKRLRTFYSAADAVIDQFKVGAYGTSTMEAMACGKPVIIGLDISRYAPYFSELPPFVTGKSDEEIYLAMLKLSDNKGDVCRQISRKSREWIMEFHGTKNNFDKLIGLCRASIA